MKIHRLPIRRQFYLSISFVLILSIVCFFANSVLNYRAVALLMLMGVSLTAMLFEIFPVVLSAVLSALIWNFFFIPPIYTFHIGTTEDTLMFLLYFFIALVHGVLTNKIRNADILEREKIEKEKTIVLYNTLLNSLSHELRTPIATIIGSVDTIKDPKIQLSRQKELLLLDEINKAGNRLNDQVENLLSMSRLESGMLKPKLDWCDINELIFQMINKMESDQKSTVHYTENADLPLVKTDWVLIDQILFNLTLNAIQNSLPGSPVNLSANIANENLVLIISDQGKGFSNSEKEKIFEKFYRPAESAPGGLGLGLSIVKGYMQALNGIIEIESELQKGTTIRLSIPAETTYIANLKNE